MITFLTGGAFGAIVGWFLKDIVTPAQAVIKTVEADVATAEADIKKIV